jgi:hypothetical protein
VAHAAEGFVFISGSGVNVDSDAGEWAGKRFGRYSEAIWERGYPVELDGILLSKKCQPSVAHRDLGRG